MTENQTFRIGGEPGPPGERSPEAPQQPAPSRRRGRVLALLAAVLVLTVGSGLFGGWVGTQLDDEPAAATSGDTTVPASRQTVPDLDRSSLAGLVQQTQPSIVSIETGSGEGSGVVLDTDGHVLTNNHVVASARGGVTVTLRDGESHRATVVGTDPRSDLAVLQVDDVSGLTPAEFGDSDAVQPGDSVLALGSPLGLEGTVTSGIVSAKNRTIQAGDGRASISGMIQTDAAINPGNSGGALVNLDGEVVGINTAIATAGSSGNIGVGFAIPSNTATSVAEQLIGGGEVSHAYLGVLVGDAEDGALLQEVEPGGPADQAGLRRGDVITAVGEQQVRESDDLVAAIQAAGAGDRLTVAYLRDGEQQQVTVTLGEAPEATS